MDKRTVSKKGLRWFFDFIKQDPALYPDSAFRAGNDVFIGGFFHFVYFPKHANTLPYYDQFPLAIPFSILSDGFLALNLHFASPVNRKRLLDNLSQFRKRSSNRTYMQVSYNAINHYIQEPQYAQCIRRYLIRHVQSKFIKIHETQWENITMLPTQRFVGASSATVWNR